MFLLQILIEIREHYHLLTIDKIPCRATFLFDDNSGFTNSSLMISLPGYILTSYSPCSQDHFFESTESVNACNNEI